MFGIGTQELLLILVVVLLLFGGKRVPEVARALGKGMADFRKAMRDVQREVDLEMLKTPGPDRRSPGRTESPASAAGVERAELPAAAAHAPAPPAAAQAPAAPAAAAAAPARPAGDEAPGSGAGDENRGR